MADVREAPAEDGPVPEQVKVSPEARAKAAQIAAERSAPAGSSACVGGEPVINPLARIPAVLAGFAHQAVTEYRRLDAPEPAPEPAQSEMSCTQARVETAPQTYPRPARTGTLRVPFATGFARPAQAVPAERTESDG